MLYQYVIKALIDHSGTVFTGVVLGLFGYMGWLLWQINEKLKSFLDKWEKHEENLAVLKEKMDKIDEGLYKNLLKELEKNVQEMEKLQIVVNDNNSDLERIRSELMTEIKEGSSEVKDIIMFLVNNRSRSMDLSIEEEKRIKNFCDKI
ncbi:hypothetical protein [Natronospora cellulosivora (SeqCode)]